MERITEVPAFKVNGFLALMLVLAIAIGGGWLAWSTLHELIAGLGRELRVGDFFDAELGAWLGVTLIAVVIPSISGFFTLEPNQAVVLVFFGRYVGSVREAGFWWTNPLTIKRRVSLKVRNFNTKQLKVNDAQGSPIEIGAVVVWQVVDSAKSQFAVNNYEEFIAIQSETAIRALANRYPYDAPDEASIPSLRGIPDEIALFLQKELQTRLEVAGVEILEARLSHLAYAPEIAQVMLRRQQAKAIIDARRQIVESAVGMVDEALKRISERQIVELDEERKASMINNLLVVLASDQNAQPVINTGSLYT
ncbi:SPFH domain-containing protein [Calothrix sp. PCC 7507]|uniref:SPFH domain-containing protein n=1 Tax=Calothrix sp. PCC 7507 TaxID=99598 RepID=UPI00029F44BE|nr:SPFH domain-containing protein [Calothrix sp. PCC 7507]AFY35432.1 band 7 protein [Calothrix sp. PCC 7507]